MLRQQILRGLLFSLGVLASAAPQSGSTPPTVETILMCMAQARTENRARFRWYVVTRDYTLFGKERDKSKSEVTAELTFVPPNSKTYSIRQNSGSGLGKKLVHRMLKGETKIVEDHGSTDISPDNYDFRFAGEETVNKQRCYVLELLPTLVLPKIVPVWAPHDKRPQRVGHPGEVKGESPGPIEAERCPKELAERLAQHPRPCIESRTAFAAWIEGV